MYNIKQYYLKSYKFENIGKVFNKFIEQKFKCCLRNLNADL